MALDKWKIVLIASGATVVVLIGVALMVAFLVDWNGNSPKTQPEFGGFAGPKVIRDPEGKISDEWLVLVDHHGDSSQMDEVQQELDSMDMDWSIGAKHSSVGVMTMHCPDNILNQAVAMSTMRKNALYVEADRSISLSEVASYGLDRIDQANLPLDNSYDPGQTGLGVNVYVIDTGILTTHQEFQGRASFDYTAFKNDPNGMTDCNGHGTHVSGTIGGKTYGVAKEVSLHAVKVLSCDGSGSMSGVVAGMDYVGSNRVTPAVASMSLGGGISTVTDQAVSRLKANGVTVVVAAGNDNADACSTSPARSQDAITVGAVGSTDVRASFSNYGSCVNIFAPGVNIPSSYIGSNSMTAKLSGTSMATPHVSGVAALYLQTQPAASPNDVADFLTQYSTKGKVADPQGSPNRLLYYPKGGLVGGSTSTSGTGTGTTTSGTGTGTTTTSGGTSGNIGSSLTQSEVQEILSIHNAFRAEVCVGNIQWDPVLSRVAQNWADGCQFMHNEGRTSDYQSIGGNGYVGENIAMGTASYYGAGALTELWTDEKSAWSCGQGYSGATGHYTQVVWAESTKIGCGAAICNGNRFLVCDYNPGGNFLGEDPFPPTQEACSFSCTSAISTGPAPTVPQTSGTTGAPPPPTCAHCSTDKGTLSGRGELAVHAPGDTWWLETTTRGTIKGSLEGPAGTDFDLYLYSWLPNENNWVVNVKSENTGSVEQIEYDALPGIYTWGVVSYVGAGQYSVSMEAPN